LSRHVWPYKGATVIRERAYTVPGDAPGAGEDVRGGSLTVRLYRGFASDGWKTGYEARPAFWVEGVSYTPGGKRWRRDCRRHRSEDKARAEFLAMCQHAEGCGAVLAQEVTL